MSSFFCTSTAITAGGSETINISRSLSKLKRVFVSFAAANDSESDVFRHPTGAFEFQLRIGSKLIPETRLADNASFWYQLQKSLGAHRDAARSINITKAGYQGTTFLIGLSTEKLEGNSWAGLSMKNEMCSLTHKNAGGVAFEYVILEYEQALVLGTVTEVLD